MTAAGGAAGRDPFACTVELHRFVVWRCAVAALTAASLATLALWGASVPVEVQGGARWIAAAGALAVVGLALLLFRVDAGTLRREAGGWTFEPRSLAPAEGPLAGGLAVALDLGSFMLLVFTEIEPAGRRRWLPAERCGDDREWQALRCAVHAPAAATGAAGLSA